MTKLRQYHVSNKIAGYLLALLLVFSAVCNGQTTVIISPYPQLQIFDQSGRPLAFGCIFTYQSNSTTPLTTYTDYTGATANSNPVVLSGGGSANIWIQAGVAYSFRVKSSGGTNCFSGATLYTVNGIGGGTSTLTTIVPYSTTPVFQISAQNQLFEITLTGNASSQPLTAVGIIPPGIVTWEITQDGSGGHTFTWPANSVGGATICSTANCVTQQTFIWNGTTAIATGPATYSTGAMAVPSLFDFALTANSAVCTDANQQLTSAGSCTSVFQVTYNGQTVGPGGSGNVNPGAAAHSLALNEGNGNAITGLLLGVNQIPVGQTSADPVASTLPTCGSGTFFTFTGTLPITCATPVAVQAHSLTTLSGNQTISANTATTYLSHAVTMPSAGCPCRAMVSYGAYITSSNSGVDVLWIDDGTNQFATSQVLVTGSATQYGANGGAFSPGTYANSAVITFANRINASNSGGVTVNKSSNDGTPNGTDTWLDVTIFPSN